MSLVALARAVSWRSASWPVLAGVSGTAMAGFGSPEIDPGSMVNALLVLSGGLLIVTGRRPRK